MPNKPPAPIPYPGDEYIRTLISPKFPLVYFPVSGELYIRDNNKNVILADGVSIDTRSTGNFITAENAVIVNSHNNAVFAKNAIITNTSGCKTSGADHVIGGTPNTGDGANYCSVDGDAHVVWGYSSTTTGFGNINMGEHGVVEGNNNRLGRVGFPNEFTDSTIRGTGNVVEGSNSHAIGSYIKIVGDNITVIGTGDPNNIQTFTIPGTHIINQV